MKTNINIKMLVSFQTNEIIGVNRVRAIKKRIRRGRTQ